MANRNLEPIRAIQRELVAIPGSFAPNGSSAVSAASNKGRGFTVVRTSTGLFTITLTDVWTDIVSVTASLQEHTAGDQSILVGDVSASAGTVVLTVWDASDAAVADVAANGNNRINFVIWASNMAVSP